MWVSTSGHDFCGRFNTKIPRIGIRISFNFPPDRLHYLSIKKGRYHTMFSPLQGIWNITLTVLGLTLALGVGPSQDAADRETKRLNILPY